MEIRELNKQELDQLLELYHHLHDSDDPLPSEHVVQSIWNKIQGDPNHLFWGIFENDKLVSSCVLNVIPNLTRGCRPYGVIENVVTHSNFRRKGLGKALLQHVLTYAWQQGCYKVMLLTGRKDEGTYAFYESVGFDRYAKQAFLAKP
jgi:GNAT superfamily N-acetyltransferase